MDIKRTVMISVAGGAIAVWLRDTINRGLVHGPRMFVSGQPVTTTAGHLNWLGQTADSIDEIRAAVRRHVANGVDLIKDRMERSGMRWTEAMAEAVVKLRAIYLSGDFDAYWPFHIPKDPQRLHPPGLWTVVLK